MNRADKYHPKLRSPAIEEYLAHGLKNLEGSIEVIENELELVADKTNPYYSEVVEEKARGLLAGMRMAHQIITGVRK